MFVNVNKVKLYYEKTGSGEPLILIHGNGESHKIFDAAVSVLKEKFTVYAVDSRGHGQSSKITEYHYDDMAEDIYCLIKELDIQKPVVYGFSDGGIIALLLAVKHGKDLKSIIASGANTSPQGLVKGFLSAAKIKYFFTHSQRTKLMLCEPQITDEMLKSITLPVFLTCGSKDVIKISHSKHIAEKIPNAVLKIFDGEMHGSYIVNSKKIAYYIIEVCKK